MKVKKVLTLILSLSFLLSTVVFAASPTDNGDNIEQIVSIVTKIPQEEFGGIYIDENGEIVVNLTQDTSTRRSATISTMLPATVKIERVKYSLYELEAMKTALEPYMLEYNIATLDANEVTNTVDVQLSENNESIFNLIDSLKVIDPSVVNVTVMDSDVHLSLTVADTPPENYPEEFAAMYNRGESSKLSVLDVTIYPGMVIAFHNISIGYGTAGPRSTSTAFYSAGHCIDGFNYEPDVYDSTDSRQIGQVISREFGSSGDRCLIRTTKYGKLPSENKFILGSGRYTISSMGIVGTAVEMWGGYSGITSGSVIATNQTVTVSGTTVKGLTYASYTCEHGDSGAGIFSANASSDTSAKCYGIQSIGVFQGSSPVSIASYFSPIQ